jgi:hypothetical protein
MQILASILISAVMVFGAMQLPFGTNSPEYKQNALGASQTISSLTAGSSLDDSDILPYTETSSLTTKKISWANATSTLKTFYDTVYSPIFSTSAGLFALISDETGSSGGVVRATSPTITTATINTPTISAPTFDVAGTDATGDTYYNGGSGLFTRLPIGSNGNLLTITAGLPAWSDTNSAFTFGGTTTFSGPVVISSATSSGYLKYYGDGSDGSVTVSSGTTTLTRDMYYSNLTVSANAAVETGGFRIYVSDTLTLSGAIIRNGNNGGNGATPTAGSAGTATSSGTLYGWAAGKIGGVGGTQAGAAAGAGTAGASEFNKILSISGSTGGNGGTPFNCGSTVSQTGIGAGSGSGIMSSSTLKTQITLLSLFDHNGLLRTSDGSGSGGGGVHALNGGSGDCGSGGGGGGSGTTGGVIWISVKNISITSTGAILARGGKGGNGGAGGASHGSGGGGGAGGNGGLIVLIYNYLSNAGAISVAGGVGGTGGAGAGSGGTGTTGGTGNTGTIFYF